MASLLNMSCSSLLKKGLPYDAEIEYLESSGTQWINTGISLKNSISLKVETLFTALTIASAQIYFGSLNDNFLCGQANGCLTPTYKNGLGYSVTTDANVLIKHKVIIENGKVTVDDDIFTIPTLTRFSNTKSLYLFCGSFQPTYGITSASFNYFKLWDNDEIVLDLIPVRVGNVGYMYDKVSGQLFANAGTGDFILGPDKQ